MVFGSKATTKLHRLAALALCAMIAACSGNRDTSLRGIGVGPAPCDGSCQDTPTRLTVADVAQVIAQAVAEANARGASATISVNDRVGNILAIYEMNGANEFMEIRSSDPAAGFPDVDGGLERLSIVPTALGVIAKGLTAVYFSSEGNAFSTRTANQIIQEHFNPQEFNTPGGPLFGVQISQLPCSDISRRYNGVGPDPGPHRSAIGFAADPGAFPLYKNGTPVGAVAVIADGVYSLDKIITDEDQNLDELIAMAASFGFAAPRDRRGDVITLEGKTARFSDVDFDDLASNPENATAFGSLPAGTGNLIAVRGYVAATISQGTAFGHPDSGIRPAQDPTLAGLDAFVLVDENNQRRFAPRDGAGGLTREDVEALLATSIDLANKTRSQVRKPLGSPAGIHVSVVDVNGDVIGVARTRDALVDATDVTVQKARTALFLSSDVAAARLNGVPPAQYIRPTPDPSRVEGLRSEDLSQYVTSYRDFLGLGQGLADGGIAWSTRAVGNISRPCFPDCIDGNEQGPLSKPPGEWSIFSTGAELDLVYNAVIRHIAFVLGLADTDVDQNCTGYAGLSSGFSVSGQFSEVRNGLTLFAGGFPIYNSNDELIGAIGLSGDGLEQDEFLPFVAVDRVGKARGTIKNAPKNIRADTIRVRNTNLRYAVCPQAPFIGSDVQNPCEGL